MPGSPSVKWFARLAVVALAATAASGPSAKAAGDDADKRATLYQAEARKIFERDHWSIVRNGPHGFTAVHGAASGGTTSSKNANEPAPPLIVHVSITFTPQSAGSTDCAVKIEGFRYSVPAPGEKPRVSGPYKADYPENTKYITKVLTEAEDQLGKKYPRYQAD